MRNPTLNPNTLLNKPPVKFVFGEHQFVFNRGHQPEVWFMLCENGDVSFFDEDNNYSIGQITLTEEERTLLKDAFISKVGDFENTAEYYFCIEWRELMNTDDEIVFDLVVEIEQQLKLLSEENAKRPFAVDVT